VHGGYDSQPVTRLTKGLVLVAAIAAAAAAFGLAGGARAASIIVVDDDYAQCPNAAETTITQAIADASPGDTILVCPGDYRGEGTIQVDQRVSLVGYTPRMVSMATCADEIGHAVTETSKNSIVDSFQIGANFVSIRGFTIDQAAQSGVLIPAGFSRVTVTRNVIQFASIGVNLNGSTSIVYLNCIRDNNAGGSASGTGVYSDQGLTASAINQNLFFSNDSAAITLLDTRGAGSLDNNTMTDNASLQDGDLLSIAGATNSQISGNSASQSVGSGIYLQPGAFGANSLLTISKNKLTGGGDEGIFADNASLTNSTLKDNTTTGNATYGIHLSTGNTGNTIRNNNFKNLGTQNDCQDDSAPSNTWKKDKGKTALPLGICKK
jgi:nitrous oxidase accessory protein NosD